MQAAHRPAGRRVCMATAADDWEQLIAYRSAQRSARRRRSFVSVAFLLAAAASLLVVAAATGDDRPANAAHAALMDMPPTTFTAELVGAEGPADRASGVLDFATDTGLIESRQTNYLGDGWTPQSRPSLGWDGDRLIYRSADGVRSQVLDGQMLSHVLEHVLSVVPELLAGADRVRDGRSENGRGHVVADVPPAAAEALGLTAIPVSARLDMAGSRIEDMVIQWEHPWRAGESMSVIVDFGAAVSPSDYDRSVFAVAQPATPRGD